MELQPAEPRPTERRRGKRRRFGRGLLAIELLGAAVLAIAWFWTGSFRETSTVSVVFAWALFAVRTSMFHIGLVATAAMVLFLVLRRWRLALGAIPALSMCIAAMLPVYLPRESASIEGDQLRVMSFNVLGVNKDDDAILAEIREHDPDLLIVQEVTKRRHELLVDELGYPYVQRIAWRPWYGMSVFSKRELIEPHEGLTGHWRTAARFGVELGGREVEVWAIHPPHPVRPALVRTGRHMFADLLQEMEAVDGPRMIVGDCNWGRLSPQAAALADLGFGDAFDLGGAGRGVTYGYRRFWRFLPGFRIDHVYVDGLVCDRAWNGDPAGSDHRPVVVEVGFD